MIREFVKFSGNLAICLSGIVTLSVAAAEDSQTFLNPLNPSADPWMMWNKGFYYLTTTQSDSVKLWKAESIGGLKQAKPVTIWSGGQGVWAAEFHQLEGDNGLRWFCYFTKTDGPDDHHRMYVIESKTDDILGPYADPILINTDPKNEFYAIDGTIMKLPGNRIYFLWAARPDHVLRISKMKNPSTLEGQSVHLPASGFGCEEVREGPYAIYREGRVFLTYSACDTGKPDYKVGALWMNESEDPMKPPSWTQMETPLLQRSDANGVFGPGHHSFFKSPDGKEDWIAYHGKTSPKYTYSGRSTRPNV